MADEPRDERRPTRGEQVGGIVGCLALLLALALLAWLGIRGWISRGGF